MKPRKSVQGKEEKKSSQYVTILLRQITIHEDFKRKSEITRKQKPEN
jgi:hypothetical protein